jgi:hypothetical protein
MSALPEDNTVLMPPRVSADDGDVGDDVLGLGFDDGTLELIEEDEELFALEQEADADGAADGAELPDEPDAGSIAVASGGADAGDVPELRAGFASDQLDTVESDEDLNALETSIDDGRLPGEGGALADHPANAPSRKVKAAGLGGLLGALPAPLLAQLDTITVPEPALGAISAALTLLGALTAAYLARERAPEA